MKFKVGDVVKIRSVGHTKMPNSLVGLMGFVAEITGCPDEYYTVAIKDNKGIYGCFLAADLEPIYSFDNYPEMYTTMYHMFKSFADAEGYELLDFVSTDGAKFIIRNKKSYAPCIMDEPYRCYIINVRFDDVANVYQFVTREIRNAEKELEPDVARYIRNDIISTLNAAYGVSKSYYYAGRGSGKTQIALDQIEEALKRGDKVIVPNRYMTLMKPEVKDVIFNGPATIIIWKDGSKTIVKCMEGEEYDAEKGLAMALSKKYLGDDYVKTFKKYLKEYENQEKETLESALNKCSKAIKKLSDVFRKEEPKPNLVQKAYYTLYEGMHKHKNSKDPSWTDLELAADEALGYLGEALAD